MDVVGEEALAVELDHGQPLPVAGLELGIPADIDLLELERMPRADVLQHLSSPLAEVAAGRREEREPNRYG
jgi:hypothetical protein